MATNQLEKKVSFPHEESNITSYMTSQVHSQDGDEASEREVPVKHVDDLKATLLAAEQDANNGECGLPRFQIRILSLTEFVDQVPCDAMVCGLEPDGDVIAIDSRF